MILNDALGSEFGAMLYDACVNILTTTKGAVYVVPYEIPETR